MKQQPNSDTHIIVGDGITAVAFLDSCQQMDVTHVLVIGRSASQLGRGAAYAKGDPDTPWQFSYLLNSPADDIDPRFAQWIADRWPHVQQLMANRKPDWLASAAQLIESGDLYGVNAPRELYGDFMVEQAATIIDNLQAQGVRVTRMEDVATAIRVTDHGIEIDTESGKTLFARSVDVAPGGPSTMRIDGDDGAYSVPSLFGHEARIATHVQRGAEIFCIGGNASMLDVLRLCQSLIPEYNLRFKVCAPDGEIPPALIPRLPRKLTVPVLSKGHETAASFLSEVEREIARAKACGDEMREIRAGFRAHFLDNPLNHYVVDSAEAQKVPGLLRFWLRGGTRDTIVDMHRLVNEGRITIIKGLVKSIAHSTDSANVIVIDDEGCEAVVNTGFVVNCAGAGSNSRYDPLTQNMLDQGLISFCNKSRGLIVGAGCWANTPSVRYLSPAVSQIGEEVIAMPLYDAHMLRSYVQRSTH